MKTSLVLFTVAAVLGALSTGCSTTRSARVLGTPSNLGNGTVASYAEFDKSGAPKTVPCAEAFSLLPQVSRYVNSRDGIRRAGLKSSPVKYATGSSAACVTWSGMPSRAPASRRRAAARTRKRAHGCSG